jgi:hypothetical protein
MEDQITGTVTIINTEARADSPHLNYPGRQARRGGTASLFCARLQAKSKFPEVIPRRIFRLGALMVWPELQSAAQQLVESIVAGVLNGQVSAES